MTESSFSTTDFIASAKPWDYMVQSRLCEPDSKLPMQELTALHTVLNDLDDDHLGNALVIGENFAPELFAADAAKLLGHPNLGVRINASRVIGAVPAELLSDSLREAVSKGLLECPEREVFADILSREGSIGDIVDM